MRVAVFGTGRMGLRHLQVVRELGWDIVGVLDQNEATLAQAGKQFGIPACRQYREPRHLMEQAKPECVIVATTAPGHGPLTCLAAETGARYILCEKPMASSLAECDRMIAACESHGVRLAVNHQTRFMPQYLAARRILQSEDFGPWTSITVVAGNVGLAMNGVHYFELLRWLSGERPREVTAWLSGDPVPNLRGAQFKDATGAIRATTWSGKRLYMDLSADQGHGIRTVYAGRTGMLVADELSGKMQLAVRGPEHRELPTARYGMASHDSSLQFEPADVLAPTRAVLEALIADGEYPTGDHGRTAVATLVAAHVSDQQGHRAVSTEGTLPRELTFQYA
ncbi:MAG TPA: Gfo/Idh/MocA family oxidoreductase [Terriglobales bacterium]|nr:Gfo/Idh/MocA family oxidoreductase [Terriglobales bacterium]